MSEKAKPAASIDWQEIHSRLERARVALEQGAAPPVDEVKKVLKARAKVLAREPEARTLDAERIEVVGFLLAYESYAIESSFVREVWPLKHLAPLPGTPPFVAGIVNVRGRIVSVINLKKFFDLPEKGLTDLNKVIILRDGRNEFGILADSVLSVGHILRQEMQQTLPTLTGVRAEYIKGVTSARLIMLDAVKLMSDPKINLCQTTEPQPRKII